MVQHAIENLQTMQKDLHFIFVIKKSDCITFHLDDTLRLLTEGECEIIVLDGETKGAACSALLAVDAINNENPLVIANFDQVIDCNLSELYDQFHRLGSDAGCLVFSTTHPRWSFVLLDGKDCVLETAEKRPLSRNAIAGFYYYKQGKDFVEAAKSMILKSCSNAEIFYISTTFNELILHNKSIKALRIPNEKYHSFYTPQKIEEYEKDL